MAFDNVKATEAIRMARAIVEAGWTNPEEGLPSGDEKEASVIVKTSLVLNLVELILRKGDREAEEAREKQALADRKPPEILCPKCILETIPTCSKCGEKLSLPPGVFAGLMAAGVLPGCPGHGGGQDPLQS